MNTTTTDLGRAVRDATEQFLVGDAPALADELTDALLSVSALVSAFRKHLPAKGAIADDLGSIDDAFSRSVVLARKLSTAIRAHRDPGAFADVARIARDLGRHIAPAMPEGTAFTVLCPSSPAVAKMPPPELRRVLSMLVRRVFDGLVERAGDLTLEVTEVRSRPASPADVRVLIGHRGLGASSAAEAADDVRSNVNGAGGSVEPCARPKGGAAVVLLLPSAC